MKTIAIIPAKSGPGKKNKNIDDFIGRPIISYSIEEAKKSKLFDMIHVSSDSAEIVSVAESLGADVSFMRPKCLSKNKTSLFSVVEWTLEKFKKRGEEFDNVFIIFPRSPLLCAIDFCKAYELYNKNSRECNIRVVSEAQSRIEKYFRCYDNILVPVDKKNKHINTENLNPAYYEVRAFSISPSDVFLKNKMHKDIAYKIPLIKAINVEIDENIILAEVLYKIMHG
ncbi:hypothetical protein LCGC14_1755830 [marine sediment metagenome]|uniref:CMP-N-acetylneuraminic acid synthetase n=1 Tax=marine sediment metagenome TaxID=412755 RepID=A0A0F9JHQ9_9ZZZZ